MALRYQNRGIRATGVLGLNYARVATLSVQMREYSCLKQTWRLQQRDECKWEEGKANEDARDTRCVSSTYRSDTQRRTVGRRPIHDCAKSRSRKQNTRTNVAPIETTYETNTVFVTILLE